MRCWCVHKRFNSTILHFAFTWNSVCFILCVSCPRLFVVPDDVRSVLPCLPVWRHIVSQSCVSLLLTQLLYLSLLRFVHVHVLGYCWIKHVAISLNVICVHVYGRTRALQFTLICYGIDSTRIWNARFDLLLEVYDFVAMIQGQVCLFRCVEFSPVLFS